MNKLKLFAMTLLIGVIPLAGRAAEKGLSSETWWRIVNGPGAGVVLRGADRIINDLTVGAQGHIADPDACECLHYHGTLFALDDPHPTACGWGCVVRAPCTTGEAGSDLQDQINLLGLVSPSLAAKLSEILTSMDSAADKGCYTVVEGLADAFADELYGYFGIFGNLESYNPLYQALVDYMTITENDMDLDYDHMPVIAAGSVKILGRVGSGSMSELIDIGPKLNLKIGSVVSLEAYGPDVDYYRWSFKWKGAEIGESPSGCSASFLENHFSAMSEKTAQVKVTLWGMMPDHKMARDTVTLNFGRINF